MDQDELKRILRRRADDSGRSRLCPDETRIAHYVGGTMPEKERIVLEEHLADCAWCLGQVGVLARTEELKPPRVPSELLSRVRPADTSRGWSLPAFVLSPRLLAPVAAGLAVVAALQLLPRNPDAIANQGPGLELRSTSESPVDSPVVVSPREGEMLPRSALELHWLEVPGALDYEVQVTTTAGDLVWHTRSDATYARPPATLPIELERKHFVWVRAYLQNGGVISSPPVSFELGGR